LLSLSKKRRRNSPYRFDVEDIVAEIAFTKGRFIVLNENPKKGADNKLVAFFASKSTNGVLIELCQEIK
jgi:methylmalonyl-CoA/ethylmalonyl-CoA epimerase